ncbi:hypothetical protein COY34_02275 [candidate division WWE3 bacterium CG_4_10_14_0_2_um_filter_42_8]|uniref:Uncharacterized protein n=1 Tax=candidate division WWE3 bacterium CG_4_10_14_0_2_um_filter_42_8 TaxID=1975074 RepID=A0A2M7TC20_UNCKA|nr:MAG: hypothetical protein COY34_02275 [candidate division WWE3 bacterium CG_4_10_14_0_2_um_filter_42_8]
MRGIITVFLSLVMFTVLIIALVLGYLGFIPGLSSFFKADKPQDLGITYTDADWQSALQKTEVQLTDLPSDTPPQESIQFKGQKDVKANFTDEELTALANNSHWIYYPFSNVQIKIDKNGIAEISGIIFCELVSNYAQALNYSEGDLMRFLAQFQLIKAHPPFYLKGTGTVINGRLNFEIEKIKVGKFSFPSNLKAQSKKELVGFSEFLFQNISGFSVDFARLNGSQLKFQGTLPEEEARAVE